MPHTTQCCNARDFQRQHYFRRILPDSVEDGELSCLVEKQGILKYYNIFIPDRQKG